jgi:hypothetical protein
VARSRQQVYWACQLAGWSIACALSLTFVLARDDGRADTWRFLITYGAGAPVAIAWTHAYRFQIRRWGWIALAPARLVPRLIAACVVVATAITATLTPVWYVVFGGHLDPVWRWGPSAVLSWTWSVMLWSLIYFAVHYFERWRQLELEKLQLAIVAKEAQLQGLMAQLQPHFLFNCLNSVRALIVEDPAKAQATVTALSSLMRYSLQATTDSTVTLATELEMVRTYLGLEAVRFDERLASEIDVPDEVAALRVPAMLVQSLVENGVKHGIERTPAGGTIRVAAWREDAALRISVVNPGRLGGSPPSTQIGLANARERLRLIYGPAATLELRDADRTVIAEVSIPLEAA